MRLRVIVNPAAAGGSAGRRLPEVLTALKASGLDVDAKETVGPGDAPRLLALAREAGVDCVAVMGGDGTLNEVVQGYIDERGNLLPGPDLALIPFGTGGDFRKTFDLQANLSDAVARLTQAAPRALDLGVLDLTNHDGSRTTKAFINITSFGLGGLTDRIVNSSPKWMGGRAAFFLGTLRAMVAYRNAPVRVRVDGKIAFEAPIMNVAIANGRYFGGGMQIAPEADPSDGLFDVVALCDLTRTQGIALAHRIYQGTHVGQPGIQIARGAVVEAETLVPNAEVLIDMDGETPGRLPLRARVLPGALRIRV